jgi:DNA-binding MarR family transcriptional regulator
MPVQTAVERLNGRDYLTQALQADPADAAFASSITTSLISLAKAMAILKQRLHVPGQPEATDTSLLFKLGNQGPQRASDLAEQLCADQSTVSRQVSGLVKAGWIERTADPDDGRASILRLTAAGEARLAELLELRGRLFAPLFADWDEADRTQFAEQLNILTERITANIDVAKEVAVTLFRSGSTEGRTQ